ncbi:MAG: glycosyltransferase family 2 protein [Gemmatimonadaceae bacterium]
MTLTFATTVVGVLLFAQGAALVVLLRRLMPGRRREPPVSPLDDSATDKIGLGAVSVIVATLNEAARIGPCLEGLHAQGGTLLEVLVVDSNSTDGTRELVQRMMQRDTRFQLVSDGVLPSGWIGKVWALETGLQRARGEWVLGIDADTVPQPGMVKGILRAMQQLTFDAASFGPRFIGQSAAERWVQPAMLTTLIYRCGANGPGPANPERVLANGQCFMARKSVLLANGGYGVARASFSDDVTLARHLATRGARVGFLDGSRIISVRAYRSAREMWREWGRSFDLKDGTTQWRRWSDVVFVWFTMALPVPVLLTIIALQLNASPEMFGASATASIGITALAAINALMLGMRIFLVWAIRGSYGEHGWTFWLSWLADIPAAIRLTMSTAKRPRAWRGRMYREQKPLQT